MALLQSRTAAAVFHSRAGAAKPFMDMLNTQRGGIAQKDDAAIAKNCRRRRGPNDRSDRRCSVIAALLRTKCSIETLINNDDMFAQAA